ncbi:MAG TPA: hypothetical protein VKB19_15125, partial [Pedobacter sp.]|nr:hypothetical protein [Pedobacter sp.]
IQDKLYRSNRHEAILKEGVNRPIFFIANVRLHYHIDTLIFSEANSVIKNLKSDTLIYLSKPAILKYYVNRIELDSIEIN